MPQENPSKEPEKQKFSYEDWREPSPPPPPGIAGAWWETHTALSLCSCSILSFCTLSSSAECTTFAMGTSFRAVFLSFRFQSYLTPTADRKQRSVHSSGEACTDSKVYQATYILPLAVCGQELHLHAQATLYRLKSPKNKLSARSDRLEFTGTPRDNVKLGGQGAEV